MEHLRKGSAVGLLLVTPLGFLFKFYRGPFAWWFNDYGAGLLYEVFWILLVAAIWPQPKTIRRAPPLVFAITSSLEVAQLWHPAILERVRATFIGKALIGTSFAWLDFPHYLLGCALAYAYLRWLREGTVDEP